MTIPSSLEELREKIDDQLNILGDSNDVSGVAANIMDIIRSHMEAVIEHVIGEDRDYEKYGQCPNGCGMQYGCRCDSAEDRVKNEQRQRAKSYLEGEK